MKTLILAICLLALVVMFVFWRVFFRFMLRSVLSLLEHPAYEQIVSLAFVCVTLFATTLIFKFTLILMSYHALVKLGGLSDNFFWSPFAVLLCIVIYTRFWRYIGSGIMETLKRNLIFFLCVYRWRRFIYDCFYGDMENSEYKSATYLADWVHYLVLGQWKVTVVNDFRARSYPPPRPTTYEQLQNRFLGEFSSSAETGTHSIIVEDICNLAKGAHYD
ncbi:hypothetical protein F5B19DRAFT_497832 [Rostrohypoxylon terebratum]|nr:hypothetical protein F5B19DRAFT_497832 [Rostrohypoxylon terebratum]